MGMELACRYNHLAVLLNHLKGRSSRFIEYNQTLCIAPTLFRSGRYMHQVFTFYLNTHLARITFGLWIQSHNDSTICYLIAVTGARSQYAEG